MFSPSPGHDMSEVSSIEKPCYTYGKTLSGKFCESVGLQEDNFPVRLYELDKEELTNGLMLEIAIWAKTKANKHFKKPSLICITFVVKMLEEICQEHYVN